MKSYEVQIGFATDRKKRSHFKHWCDINESSMEETLNKFIDLVLSQKINPKSLDSYFKIDNKKAPIGSKFNF